MYFTSAQRPLSVRAVFCATRTSIDRKYRRQTISPPATAGGGRVRDPGRATPFRFQPFATAAAVLAAMVMTACGSTGTPQDGRYQTHGSGRDNFRAEGPTFHTPTRPS